MKKCTVKLNEALDEAGKPVATINERIHKSALSRYAAPAQLYSDDLNGTCSLAPYRPETLTPFYSSGVFAGLPVVDWGLSHPSALARAMIWYPSATDMGLPPTGP
jgi:hypothetical protein